MLHMNDLAQSLYCFSPLKTVMTLHLLTRFGETHHLKHYCLPEVIELVQYDKLNNSSYLDTLRVYLRSRNVAIAAGELHIHRNTMNYRIQKIEEITHLNLNEGEDLYKLWFSLLILEMEA